MLLFTFLEEQARDRTSSALAAAEQRRSRRTIRERAAERTDRLARAGRLPRHLVGTASGMPIVVARTLGAGWRRLLRVPDGAGNRVNPARGR